MRFSFRSPRLRRLLARLDPLHAGVAATAPGGEGIAVFPLLPVAPLPQVDFPTSQFSLISGLSRMTSVNSSGATLQFDLDRSIDAAAQDVQSAITGASGQLPSTLPGPPTLRKTNPADSPI